MKHLKLRLPDELHAVLADHVKSTGRSLNSEICRMLEAQLLCSNTMKMLRETVRQEMRAEFEERRPRPFNAAEYLRFHGLDSAQ